MMRTHKEFRLPNRETGPLETKATASIDEFALCDKRQGGCDCAPPEFKLSRISNALRRRWKIIAGVGLILAMAIGVPVKLSMTPSYNAIALLRIASFDKPLAFESREMGGESMFESARATYKELFKSRPVLSYALRDPAVASLADATKAGDPLEWLGAKIKIAFVERSSEILQVSVSDGKPEQASLLADAVADGFLKWCGDAERKRRNKQIEELRQAYDDKQAEIARRRADYADLVEAAGGVDAETLARRGETGVRLLAELQKEKTRLKFELQRAESEKQSQKNLRIDISKPSTPIEDLAGLGQNDPLANKLLLDLEEMERYASKVKAVISPQAAERLEVHAQLGDIATAREHYLARLLELQRRKETSLEADAERFRSQIAILDEQASRIEKEIEERNTETEKKRTSLVEIETLKADITRTEEVLGQITRKIKETEVELGSIPPVSLVQRSETPKNPCNLALQRATVVLAVLLAFLFPGCCIVVWDLLRRYIDGPDDASLQVDIPVLGTMPEKKKRRFDPMHFFRADKFSRQRVIDAVESLQMMVFDDRRFRNRVVMLCSAESDEGTADMAKELAVCLAKSDYRTVLVDADFRQPRLHRDFDVPLTAGVGEILGEKTDIWDILHETEIENLWIAPAGERNDKIHAALVRGNAALLIDTLRSIFQFVIIAGGPVLQGSETRYLGRYADAVLFSLKRDATHADKAVEAVKILRSLHINLLGATVTM
jgi:Mrp family chromosome partitioning ATPase